MAQEEFVSVKQYFDSLRGEQRTHWTGHDAPEGSLRRRPDVAVIATSIKAQRRRMPGGGCPLSGKQEARS